jgi:protein TonB
MEIKKSAKADLEGKRPQRFLLGLMLALATLFVALEYTFEPNDPLDDPELLEQLSSDEELAPLFRQENELVLAPKAEPEPAQKLKVVQEDEVKQEELDLQQEQPLEGDVADVLPEEEEQQPSSDNEVLNFRVVEDLPQFPGGYLEFMKWLTRNLKYPSTAEQRKLQGKVVAEFIVNKDGSVTDVRIVSSLSPDCDNEALRVLRMMPRWTAGVQNDKPCRTKVCIPIVFKM